MSTIVVTTDLSDAAKRALPVAGVVAGALELPQLLLHVIHAPLLAPALAESGHEDRDDAEAEVRKLADSLDGTVTPRVVEAEDVAAGIVAETERVKAELLVMASHGRTGLERLRLGSIAEKVLETSSTPVMCVPARADELLHGSRVVVASDLSDSASHAFPIARRLAVALGLSLTLLVVDDPQAPRDMSGLARHASELGEGSTAHVTTEVVSAPDPAAGIIGQAELDDAALVCTAAAPKSPLRRLLLGSVCREVMRSAAFPVVIVPPARS